MKVLSYCALVLFAQSMRGDLPFRAVSRQELIDAMTVQKRQGYNVLATPNAARFSSAVILHLARAARERDALRTPLLIHHRDYFEAFLAVTGIARESAPTFVRIAYDKHEDQLVDYRRENVIKEIVTGRQPAFAVNVVAGWTGPPASYTYEDRSSNPPLRVTHERVTSYRLLDFGDM